MIEPAVKARGFHQLAGLLVLSAQCCLAVEPFCDTGKPHAIDIQFDREMEQAHGVTVLMRNAQGNAYEHWDKELNRVYQDLLQSLNEDDREALRKSQRAWLKFHDADVELLWTTSLYGSGGTLAPVIVSELARSRLVERVCELTKYRQVVEHGS